MARRRWVGIRDGDGPGRSSSPPRRRPAAVGPEARAHTGLLRPAEGWRQISAGSAGARHGVTRRRSGHRRLCTGCVRRRRIRWHTIRSARRRCGGGVGKPRTRGICHYHPRRRRALPYGGDGRSVVGGEGAGWRDGGQRPRVGAGVAPAAYSVRVPRHLRAKRTVHTQAIVMKGSYRALRMVVEEKVLRKQRRPKNKQGTWAMAQALQHGVQSRQMSSVTARQPSGAPRASQAGGT
jgi:hypothetical protein